MDTAETVDDLKQREHTMTEKGLELFHTTMDKHMKTLKRVSSKIDEHCFKITSGQKDHDTLELLKLSLEKYIKKSDDYISFLTHTKTAEATSELEEHTKFREDFVYKVEGLIRSSIAETTEFQPKSTLKEPSVKSHKKTSKKSLSKASLRSSNSSVLRQKAKISAETARKKLEFAQEESDLLTQKAEYEATCIIEKAKLAAKEKGLSARKEAAVAMAELNAIEEDETESESSDNGSEIVKIQLTKRYVEDQNKILSKENDKEKYISKPSQLDPSVPSFKPSNLLTTKETKHVKQEDVNNNFAMFLMKKDLLSSRIHKFDDCPENYVSWKDTFKRVVHEIGATATEELDLLLQYTGVNSRKQVISIKVANAGYPTSALERAWNRLDSRYGSPEKVETALKMKLSSMPKISYKDKNKLYELSDVLAEIQAVKEKPEYSALLSFYDTAVGVNPTISKLPAGLQSKWRDRAASYKRKHCVIFPPFTFFCDFVLEMAEVMNDPSFDFEFSGTSHEPRNRPTNRYVSVAKTEIVNNTNTPKCIIHKANHSLDDCRVFRQKTLDERRSLLKQHGICFRCCVSKHLRKDCHENIKCSECKGTSHTTAMHVFKIGSQDGIKSKPEASVSNYGEEKFTKEEVNSKCTEVCKGGVGKSCAKIVLLDILHAQKPNSRMRIYAIIDEQSNSSLVHGDILDYFGIEAESRQYSLSSCSGKVMMNGRRASGFVVQSLDGQILELPTLIECDMIPNNRNEIPTCDVAAYYQHLASIAQFIPPLDAEAKILLLIGRDLMQAHHVLDQKIGKPYQPYAQRLKLGWIIVGESCLDGAHIPKDASVLKTFIDVNGKSSVLEPCSSKFHVSDCEQDKHLFKITKDDDKPSLSIEDRRFLELMDTEMKRDDNSHNWIAPLPFKPNPDDATRNSISAVDLPNSLWLKGPNASFIDHIDEVPSSFPLVTPDEDCEVRILKTTVGKEVPFGIHRFENFSTWISLVRAVTTLKTKLRTIGFSQDKNRRQVTREESQHFILQAVQKEFFSDEISALSFGEPLHKDSKILNLSPYLDEFGLLRKWQQDRKNVQEGDVVLMCDKSLHRNEWPVGIIIKTHTSDDNRVRKVDVRLGKDRKTFTRPVNELIVLLPN
ncbi:unnamed protein product [Mytilus edulis]|uniref:DUF5641 domain-containing protein n=1 Tax=Mytilus edulis TaxID=6550 RepID=A0A8S3VLY5_MYTED|nr:unnamed protein product [Mytilus edulis]